MKKIKAIIFDMDGVLIDAKDWHYEALNKALGLFGMQINRYDHLVTYDGYPTQKKLDLLSMECGLPLELQPFINELKQLFTMEIVEMRCKPKFQHEYALAKLKQEGYSLAVCSNSIRGTIELMLRKANLLKYFDFYLSNQDVVKSKPDPEIYVKAIKKLGLRPEECLIIEDNEKGIKAALASKAGLLEVDTVEDVNYQNIKSRIHKLEGAKNA
ncbi:MAG: HAD family hydrolase [Elusimicrobia bacterium GWB2_63_22]|nr:MAG: HAD family hydrolase [Elusimicrobia bacterium GWB2_63_22]